MSGPRSAKRALILAGSFLVLSLFAVDGSASTTTTLSLPPYKVTFHQVSRKDRFFSIQTLVACDGQAVTLSTAWRAKDFKSAVRELGDLTGVKDGFLFTPGSCGGGNAWRCEVEYVIRSQDGPRVLGAVGRHVDWKIPGESLKDGLFRDGFDGCEINPFTNHAMAPSFEILLELKKDRFAVAKDATWRMNGERMRGFRRVMTSKADLWTIRSAYMGALALTRLCGKGKERLDLVRTGKNTFGVNEGETMAAYVEKVVARYRPARIPQ